LLRSTYYMKKGALPDMIKKLQPSKLNYLEDLIAVFVTDSYDKSGGSFLYYLKLNRIMPKQVLIVSIAIEDHPYIKEKERDELKKLCKEIYTLTLHYGFMQTINIPRALASAGKRKTLPFSLDPTKTIYFVEAINIAVKKKKYRHFYYWQKKLFYFLLRNAELDTSFFKLPNNKTISIGTYCEI
jgi:KUP system potassium uptake protein